MKTTLTILCFLFCNTVFAQGISGNFVTTDIDNFWAAYDQIITTKDSTQQYEYLNRYFITQGSPGQLAMMKARGYTSKSYIEAIFKYPVFWNSIRSNMFRAKDFSAEISGNVTKLKTLYPDLRPAKIYFTVGAFRSGGTTMDSLVLIGSEIAMVDDQTDAQEFQTTLPDLYNYFKTNPINTLVFTNVHEYVHTQQKTTEANNLLGQAVLEGVAEFLAEKATGKASIASALSYGKTHRKRVQEVFSSVMFNGSNGFWLYNNEENEFGTRDLGYYVGYAICESYYNRSNNKKQAIKEMIELDYNNEMDLDRFVTHSGYFEKSVATLKKEYEYNRPFVKSVEPVNHKAVSASITEITINFSEVMDKRYRNFELGPLGKEKLLQLKKFLGFSEDGRSVSFQIEIQPDHQYQILVGKGFRNIKGLPLKEYLIDFKTKAN
ncbi:DUF2268 domain-containing putative Zn-dependent protease [Pedobacter cryoconitis]|uniref:DUF2268 domain-containing protein n=1 Tax=Pedobacter cryoconitis TaxID=188932 RepID=A0A7X0ML88_9SPHI|nr:DUF2268 domain-containing putative Zn-dependent protease [Pedobacter cryoconitis]MBB6501168.1 hypothetical protein [Pedobacter cryoconitis]